MICGVKVLRKAQTLFILFLGAFLIYAALFIYRTSFVIDDERYFSLFDDAMISMRYARNLANGYGLVWNPGGERVEGYTNPLWVLYMALIHLLPVPQSKISLFVQMTGAVLLTVNLYFVRRIALTISEGSNSVALGAMVLTAFYLPLNFWSLQGMEVGLLALIMSLSLWRAIHCLSGRIFCFSLYVLLGASTWVRPDMVVPFGSMMLFLAALDSANRRRHLFWGAAILVLFYGSQTVFRLWYFDDVLPNTYYLKLVGYPVALRISQGLNALVQFVWKFNMLLFIVPFILIARQDWRIWLLLWMLIGQMVYSVFVGGDAWEYWGGSNRYIAIAMPGFFILLSYGLFHGSQLLMNAMNADPRLGHVGTSKGKRCIFPLLITYSLLSVNSIYGPNALVEALLISPPLHTGNGDSNHEEVKVALLLRKMTTPEATIMIGRAGTIPYFLDRYSIDPLGRTDRHVAREPMRRYSAGLHRFIEFRPGHMKWDYAYSIGQLKPDLILHLGPHGEEARPYLQTFYRRIPLQGQCWYVREGSVNVLWEKWPAEVCK